MNSTDITAASVEKLIAACPFISEGTHPANLNLRKVYFELVSATRKFFERKERTGVARGALDPQDRKAATFSVTTDNYRKQRRLVYAGARLEMEVAYDRFADALIGAWEAVKQGGPLSLSEEGVLSRESHLFEFNSACTRSLVDACGEIGALYNAYCEELPSTVRDAVHSARAERPWRNWFLRQLVDLKAKRVRDEYDLSRMQAVQAMADFAGLQNQVSSQRDAVDHLTRDIELASRMQSEDAEQVLDIQLRDATAELGCLEAKVAPAQLLVDCAKERLHIATREASLFQITYERRDW